MLILICLFSLIERRPCRTLRSYYEFRRFYASIGSLSLSVSALVHFSVCNKTLQPHYRISIKSCALACKQAATVCSLHPNPLASSPRGAATLRLSAVWLTFHRMDLIWPLRGERKKKAVEKETPALICSRSIDASASRGSEHNGAADKQPILIPHATSAGEFRIRVLEKATGGHFYKCVSAGIVFTVVARR